VISRDRRDFMCMDNCMIACVGYSVSRTEKEAWKRALKRDYSMYRSK
jgi:hypothetical protein